MKIAYTVKKIDEGKKLKDIIKKKLYVSNVLLSKLKLTDSILVNNSLQHVSYTLCENDKILLDFENMKNVIYNDKNNVCYKKEKYLDKYQRFEYDLDILYEDEYLLIVNKPANMAVHPSCANYESTLSNAVATYLEKQDIYSIHIVTRLDKNTSGICIFAKNEYIQELFIRKKEEVKIQKEYIAVVNNIVKKDHEIIEQPISRKENSIILREVNINGDYAKTEYFVKKRNITENYTILSIILHTGRTHQIRVHMGAIGHVLLGDTLYAKEYRISNIDNLIKRQALHSHIVSFYHPITGKFIKLESHIPDDILNLIKK